MKNINPDTKSDAPVPFGPPLAAEIADCLEIRLPKYFRDEGWAKGIGQIQHKIEQRAPMELNHPRRIVFDFTLCRWIDPFPLMSVLIEIASSRRMGIDVLIRFPEPDAGPNSNEIGPYQESPNRLLFFLARSGFLYCLENLKDNGIQYSPKPNGGWDDYRNLQVVPSYEESQCIPMHLFLIPPVEVDGDFAKRSVENLLIGIDSKLESKVSPQSRERLIYKLRVAVQELIHNAQEHAYLTKDTASRFVAIYARYRTGGHGSDSVRRPSLIECIKEEFNRCPLLGKDWLTVRPGCLEVFVIDRGIGIVHSFERAGIRLKWKHKFEEVMHKTFFDGYSTKPERQTLYGGLHLLHNLLADTSDFIRAFEGDIWFGCGVPFLRSTATNISFAESQSLLRGLAIHLRLGWREETDLGEEWVEFEKCQQSELWPELCLDASECTSSFNWFENQPVIDERFHEQKTYGTSGEMILWLVRPHRMKWDILTFLEKNVSSLSSGSSVLIIGEIPSYEAETYAAALSEFKASGVVDWPSKFSRIILFTNRWRFAALDYQKHGYRHGFSSLYKSFETLRINNPPIWPRPKNFRLAIVRWLKWHDSRRLWDEVIQHRQMFIAEQISWAEDESGETNIAGYLDFPETIHNSICADIYRNALIRVLGVLPSDKVSLFPLDRLTAPVLREIHVSESYEPSGKSKKLRLALGSVLVSGTTLASSPSSNLDLHFFVHFSSPLKGEKPSLLFWLPKEPVRELTPRFSRIGRTSSIAPEGWKSFEVPRFDRQEKCVGARTPSETYQDMQNLSPVIFKAGHWAYEGHHDFLTVNIASAVEASFIGKKELARFLVSRILAFIGLKSTHIVPSWRRMFDGRDDHRSKQFKAQGTYGLMVYRSHPCSDSIVGNLLGILTQEGRDLALSRIFSVLPVRLRWGASTFLIPPLVREEIRKALNGDDGSHPVLLFDDAAITGRTLKDLQAVLSAIGATQIHTLVIANRLRRPADGLGAERLDYYWRLDVPSMGQEGSCPFCSVLDLAEEFSISLAATSAKREIANWKHIWGETSPLNNWSTGLRPLPLSAPEKETKFCYRQSLSELDSVTGKHLAKIDLLRSTGLSIRVTELHAMTGRDDYSLKKLKQHHDPEIRVELAASQIFLFGPEFDMDVRLELIKAIILELPFLKEDSPYPALAFLAIMSGLRLLDDESRVHASKIVHGETWRHRSNYVSKLLLAYLASQKLIDENSEACKIGRSLLTTTSWSLAQRLKAWFLETFSPAGNAHSQAIPLLIAELTKGAEIKDWWIKDAMDSLDFLSDVVSRLETSFVRRKNLEDIIKTCLKCRTLNAGCVAY